MLGKLLKYELRATARMFIPLYLTLMIFTLINYFFFPIHRMSEEASTLYAISMTLSMIIYITLMVGLIVMTLIVMIQRFYKNLLGDEGYLMFTLPVQTNKHIFSKLAISMFWTIASSIVAFCSILILSSQYVFTKEFFNELSMALDALKQYFGAFGYLISLEVIVLGLLSLASTILTIYAAIALGQLFNKHKLLISFAMYIVLKTISQILMTVFVYIFANKAFIGIESNFIPSVSQVNGFMLLSIIYFGIITVAYYMLTEYVLKRRLNLE